MSQIIAENDNITVTRYCGPKGAPMIQIDTPDGQCTVPMKSWLNALLQFNTWAMLVANKEEMDL